MSISIPNRGNVVFWRNEDSAEVQCCEDDIVDHDPPKALMFEPKDEWVLSFHNAWYMTNAMAVLLRLIRDDYKTDLIGAIVMQEKGVRLERDALGRQFTMPTRVPEWDREHGKCLCEEIDTPCRYAVEVRFVPVEVHNPPEGIKSYMFDPALAYSPELRRAKWINDPNIPQILNVTWKEEPETCIPKGSISVRLLPRVSI